MNEMTVLAAFISGAIALAFAAIALCFQRFWRRSRIRLFNLFAIAFALLALERVIFVIANPDKESAPYLYVIRLIAFGLIIAGIIQHNRKRE